jgi:hypothetical protein
MTTKAPGSFGNPIRLLMHIPVPWVFILAYLIGVALELAVPSHSKRCVVRRQSCWVGALLRGLHHRWVEPADHPEGTDHHGSWESVLDASDLGSLHPESDVCGSHRCLSRRGWNSETIVAARVFATHAGLHQLDRDSC